MAFFIFLKKKVFVFLMDVYNSYQNVNNIKSMSTSILRILDNMILVL